MIQHENARVLLSHWADKRRGGAPERSQLDPGVLRSALPNTFILERVDRRHMPFRLAGAQVCDMFGKELRTQNFLDLWSDTARLEVQNLMCQMLGRVAPVTLIGHAQTLDGRTANLEWVMAPVRSSSGLLDRVIGCAHLVGRPSHPILKPFVRQSLFALCPPMDAESLFFLPSRPAAAPQDTGTVLSVVAEG